MPPKKLKLAADSPDLQADVEAPVAPPASRRVRNEVAVEAKVKFSVWFLLKAAEDKRLKSHHADAIQAYMGSQGLSAEEPAWRYDAALRQYFGV